MTDDAPLYPLIGFTLAMVDGAVALELEIATDREGYEKREGSVIGTVMTPENAVEIGKALMETGQLSLRPAGVTLS